MFDNTYIYITVVFRCVVDTSSTPIDLIRLELVAGDSLLVPFEFETGGGHVPCEQLTIDDIMYAQTAIGDDAGNKFFTVRVNLATLADKGLIESSPSVYYLTHDFSFKIYWYGQTSVEFDYIDIEDSVHKDMLAHLSDFHTRINDRIEDLQTIAPDGNGTISLLYSFDEPLQPQFDSYKRVQDLIDTGNPNIMTASYIKRCGMLKSPNDADPLKKFYQHPTAFLKKIQPRIFAPDLYPITPYMEWNGPIEGTFFIQRLLDDNLLCRYKSYRESIPQNDDNFKFYPIVQSFGNWDESGQWMSWLRPPKETQKMLQYLPLCYGADGIINYLFPTFTTGAADAEGQYGALLIVHNGSTISNYEPQSNS